MGETPLSGPWDKYAPTTEPATTSGSDGPWSKYADQTPAPAPAEVAQDGILADAAKSGATGVAKGVANIIGAPEAGIHAGVHTFASLLDRSFPGVGKYIEGIAGLNTPILPRTQDADAALAPVMHEPQTLAGDYAETIGEFAPASLAPGGALRRVANVLTPAIGSETAGQLTKGTDLELPARILGGLAGAGAVAAAPKIAEGASAMVSGSGPTEAARVAHDAGYVLPPAMASDDPGAVSKGLGALSGKVKLQQAASARNQSRTNELAAQAIGLPPDEPITEAALEGIRREAGQAYEAVKRAPVEIIPDDTFKKDVTSLSNIGAAARAEAPELVGNPELDTLSTALASKERLSPDAAVDLVKSLRYRAQTNLKNYTSPEKMDLGRAQSKAANALEGLIERNLAAATTARGPIGAQGGDMSALVDNLQKARQTIAKTYDIESALNPSTGNIDAQKIAKLASKGKPLTDELAQIADAAGAFPKAFQDPSKFGGEEKFSVMDVGAAAVSHGASIPASLARPTVRTGLLSSTYQDALMRNPIPQPGIINSIASNPAPALLTLPTAVGKEKALQGSVDSR